MSSRHLLLAGFLATSTGAFIGACATNEGEGDPVDSRNAPVPPRDPDAQAADASVEAGDAGPCVDCEYFTETCAADVLCPHDLFRTNGGFDPRTQINVITGRSPNDVWIGGALGAVAHFDGTSWTASDVGNKESVRTLWLRDSSEVSLVTLGHISTRGIGVVDAGAPSAGGWIDPPAPTFPTEYGKWLRGLISGWAAPGAEWFWGATQNFCNDFSCVNNVKLKTSGLWRLHTTPDGKFEIASAISSTLCQQIACTDMTAIHGASANELWAVGNRGATLHITGAENAEPTIQQSNSQTWNALHGVWVASQTEAWAVGAQGTIRRFTGNTKLWDVVSDVPTANDLHAVWGSSSSDIWAVGDAGTVLHYDGKSWSRVKIAGLETRRPNLTAVWVPSPGHVWIGGQGVLLSLGGLP